MQGAITGHSPVVNDWPVSTDLEHLVEKYKYAFQSTEKIAFGLIKLSLLCLWERILGSVRAFQIACRTMMIIVALWMLAFFGATIFQCGTNWQLNWAPIGVFLTQCSNTLDMLTVFTATDLLTDFVIMLMPTPIIWSLSLPIRKRLGIMSLFMVALLYVRAAVNFYRAPTDFQSPSTIGAGIARMYIYLTTSYDKEDNPDFIADFTLFILWSEIEVNVAMLVCCMPVLAPVIGKARDTIRSVVRCGASKWTLLSADHKHSSTIRVPSHWPDMAKYSEHP